MFKNSLRNETGFTLIEIVVIIAIIGFLAAIAIPRYLDSVKDARIMAAQGAIAEIKSRLSSAQFKYIIANNGVAPTSFNLYTYAISSACYGSAVNLANVGNDFSLRVSITPFSPNILINVDKVTGVAVNVQSKFKAAGDP